MDIKKFYPSVNNEILKKLLRTKFKDKDLLQWLDEVVSSYPGLPIGSFVSQYLANFYLSKFDHWVKQVLGVKCYLRYADDIVIISDSKHELHALRAKIANYLFYELDLEVKSNYQVFPIEDRGIDYLGYVFRRKYILLRKRIKLKYKTMMKHNRNSKSIASYNGWLLRANTKNLRAAVYK